MPRPALGTLVPACALGVLIAFVPSPTLAGALASAAGTLLEALPFIVGAALLPRARWLRFLPSLACGCGGALPPAFSLPALALTWISFGPFVSIARVAAALVVLTVRARARTSRCAPQKDAEHSRDVPNGDALAELTRFALASFAASLIAESLRTKLYLAPGPAGAVLSLTLGIVAGLLAPCATAGIAASIALRAVDSFAAFGLLATSGLISQNVVRDYLERIPFPRSWTRVPRAHAPNSGKIASRSGGARLAFALLACACLIMLLRGTDGFLNPRFAFAIPFGAAFAAFAAIRGAPTRSRGPLTAPAIILVALVLGSPPPPDSAATIPVDLYPGRRVTFTGRVVRSDSSATVLVRSAILCCRADAQQLSLRLDRPLHAKPGTWWYVCGTAVASNSRLVVRVDSARRVTPPSDPYLYL